MAPNCIAYNTYQLSYILSQAKFEQCTLVTYLPFNILAVKLSESPNREQVSVVTIIEVHVTVRHSNMFLPPKWEYHKYCCMFRMLCMVHGKESKLWRSSMSCLEIDMDLCTSHISGMQLFFVNAQRTIPLAQGNRKLAPMLFWSVVNLLYWEHLSFLCTWMIYSWIYKMVKDN